MRHFVVTIANNPERMTTFNWLKKYNVDFTVVTNTKEQIKLASKITGVSKKNIISAGIPDSIHKCNRLTHVRNFIMDQLVEQDEYVVLVNDNIHGVGYLRTDDEKQDFTTHTSTEWRQAYKQPIKPTAITNKIKKEMVRTGSIFGGMGCPSGNYYFCPKRWNYRTFIVGDMMVTKKVFNKNEQWCNPDIYLWDDWWQTCKSLALTGSVTCLRYACTLRNESDPVESMKNRGPYHTRSANILFKHFPDLIELHPTQRVTGDIRLKVRSDNQLQQWRRKEGYIS